MSEAFHPLRYLDYWERTSPQERHNRRPAYEEHDHRKLDYPSKSYEEHDCRKVDYSKLYEELDRRKETHGKPFAPTKAHLPKSRAMPERYVFRKYFFTTPVVSMINSVQVHEIGSMLYPSFSLD